MWKPAITEISSKVFTGQRRRIHIRMEIRCWVREESSPTPPVSRVQDPHLNTRPISIRRPRVCLDTGLWLFPLPSISTATVFLLTFLRVLMIRWCFGIS